MSEIKCVNMFLLVYLIQNNDNTIKFLNFRTPENFVVIYLKCKQKAQTLGYFVKKMQME